MQVNEALRYTQRELSMVFFGASALLHLLSPALSETVRLLLGLYLLRSSENRGSPLRVYTIAALAGVNLTVADCALVVACVLLRIDYKGRDLGGTAATVMGVMVSALTTHYWFTSRVPDPRAISLFLLCSAAYFALILQQSISDQYAKLSLNNEETAALQLEVSHLKEKRFEHSSTGLKMTRSRSSDGEVDVIDKLKSLTPKREPITRLKSYLEKHETDTHPVSPFHRQFSRDSGGLSMSGSELSVYERKDGELRMISSNESSITPRKEADLSWEDIDDIKSTILSQEFVLWHHRKPAKHSDDNLLRQLQQFSSTLPSVSRSTFNPSSIEQIPLFTLMEENEELAEVMSRLGDWDFNTLDLVPWTREPLKEVAYYLFSTHSIPEKFNVSRSSLVKFLREVERRYHQNNYYHNSLHAADVLNSVTFLLSSGLHRCGHFLDLEVFSLFVASIGHDVNHPGVNNAFLINISDPLALKYNDKSVLEMMHAATVFSILAKKECNILQGLCLGDFFCARKIIVELILATDLQRHFSLQADYRHDLEDFGKTLEDDEFRLKTLEICIKCGDLGHGAKETSIHVRWTHLISQEFFAQGDREAALGLPLTSLCDRHSVIVPNSQIGFLTVMVKPLFDLWVAMIHSGGDWEDGSDLPFQLCSRRISENLQYWECAASAFEVEGREYILPEGSPPML